MIQGCILKKNTKLKTTGAAISLRTDHKGTELADSFCLLESTINSKGINRKELCHRAAPMKSLERYSDVGIPTKIRIVQEVVLPMIFYRNKIPLYGWWGKKNPTKNIMDNQENEQKGHQTNQLRILTQGTNDQSPLCENLALC